jgi:hypothetical protein
MSTAQQSLVTATADLPTGTVNLGIFDKRTGGDVQATAAKHRPGGWVSEKSYASLPTYTDVVINRVYERDRDHEMLRTLDNRAGRSMITVTEQPLDPDGHAWGNPITWRGRLLQIKHGDYDSTSAAVRQFEVHVSIETRS